MQLGLDPWDNLYQAHSCTVLSMVKQLMKLLYKFGSST